MSQTHQKRIMAETKPRVHVYYRQCQTLGQLSLLPSVGW